MKTMKKELTIEEMNLKKQKRKDYLRDYMREYKKNNYENNKDEILDKQRKYYRYYKNSNVITLEEVREIEKEISSKFVVKVLSNLEKIKEQTNETFVREFLLKYLNKMENNI